MNMNKADFSDAMFLSLTDPEAWAIARWRATVLLYVPNPTPDQVPGLALGFLNFHVGKKIFDGWLKRIGHTDPANELRVSIVEGAIDSNPSAYTVLISANPLNDDGRPVAASQGDVNRPGRSTQMNRMNSA